jgi:23S rRNA (pseudouridine1915-N3)-methyltransferase
MAIKLIVIGPTKEEFYKRSEQEYLKRLTKYCRLNYIELPASKKSEISSECLAMEAVHILKHISDTDFVLLLDERGSEYSSRTFAEQLNDKLVNEANITFVIGGAFGFADNVRSRANAVWSLSQLTFPHHLVRTIFLEQLYRAFTILNGERYHND